MDPKFQLESEAFFCRPLRGLGILRGRDPRVTLATLRSPGAKLYRRSAAR